MKINRLFFVITMVVFLGSCGGETDAENTEIDTELKVDVPTIVLYNGVSYDVSDELRISKFAEASYFSDPGRQEVKELRIEQYEGDALVLIVEADFVELDLETNNMSMSGNIYLRSEKEETTLEGDSFQWNDEEKLLESSSPEDVLITTDAGSSMTGKNLSINANTQLVEFKDRAKGLLYTSKNEEEQSDIENTEEEQLDIEDNEEE